MTTPFMISPPFHFPVPFSSGFRFSFRFFFTSLPSSFLNLFYRLDLLISEPPPTSQQQKKYLIKNGLSVGIMEILCMYHQSSPFFPHFLSPSFNRVLYVHLFISRIIPGFPQPSLFPNFVFSHSLVIPLPIQSTIPTVSVPPSPHV